MNMQHKFQQSLFMNLEVFQFINRVVVIPVATQGQICTVLLCKNVEIPQAQFLDLVVVPVLCNDKLGTDSREKMELPQVQLVWCCGVTVIILLVPAVQVVRFSRDSVRQSARHSCYAHIAVLEQGC